MMDAYRIGITLSLTNHVSKGLMLMAGDFAKTEAQAAALQKRVQGIQNMALKGGLFLGAGVGMLALLKGPLAQVTQWEKIMASMKQKGLGDAQIADAKKFITANDIYGVSMMERAKIFNEAQGSFRESGMGGLAALDAAKVMTPVLAAYKLAMGTLGTTSHAAAEGSFTQLNKIVELMGGLGDTKRAADIVGGVFKAVQGSGKMVSERDIRQFITMGGSAVSMLPNRMVFGALEPQMGEFGGSAMGTGMNTAYRLLTGTQSKPSRMFVREAIKMGLWDRNKLIFNSQGGIKQYNGQPLDPGMANLMRTDTPEFSKRLMGIYANKGITSQADRERENDILLGRTGAKIYNKVMLQLAVMEHSLKAYDQAQTPDQVNRMQKKSIMQQSAELHAKLNDLQLNLGLVILPMAITALEKLLPMVKSLAGWMSQNHTAVKLLAGAFVALAGGLMVRGSVLLLGAAFKGLGLAMALGSVGGIAGSIFGIGGAIAGVGGLVPGLLALGLAVGGIIAILSFLGPAKKDDGKDHTGEHWQSGTGRGGVGGSWQKDSRVVGGRRGTSGILQKYNAETGEWESASAVQPSARAGGTSAINNTIVMPNGDVLAKVVTEVQTRGTSSPMRGTGRFDQTRAPLSPGMNAR